MSEIYTDPLGNQWDVVLGLTLNELFGDNKYEPNQQFLSKRPPTKNELHFPAGETVEKWENFVLSGVVTHQVRLVEPSLEAGVGFGARSVHVFDKDQWDGECITVLRAHEWNCGPGGVSEAIVLDVREKFGPDVIKKAKVDFDENWNARVYELAAMFRCEPFSRLWYCANMLALYYCHHDDLRVGYLWAEYQFRMSSETATLRGKKVRAAASSGGAARARTTSEQAVPIIEVMKAYMSRNQSLSRAAELAAATGFGTSASANRRLYQRYAKES